MAYNDANRYRGCHCRQKGPNGGILGHIAATHRLFYLNPREKAAQQPMGQSIAAWASGGDGACASDILWQAGVVQCVLRHKPLQ